MNVWRILQEHKTCMQSFTSYKKVWCILGNAPLYKHGMMCLSVYSLGRESESKYMSAFFLFYKESVRFTIAEIWLSPPPPKWPPLTVPRRWSTFLWECFLNIFIIFYYYFKFILSVCYVLLIWVFNAARSVCFCTVYSVILHLNLTLSTFFATILWIPFQFILTHVNKYIRNCCYFHCAKLLLGDFFFHRLF